MNEDKEKLCSWIKGMDIEDFYGFCSCLVDYYELTGEPMFYTCDECCKEHGDECDDDVEKCAKFFYEHYGEVYKECKDE